MEPNGRQEQYMPGSANAEKSIANSPSSNLSVEVGIGNAKLSNAGTTCDIGGSHVDSKINSHNDESPVSTANEKEFTTIPESGTPVNDLSSDIKASLLDSDMEAGRSVVPQTRFRSLSPVDLGGGNKRPALVCDFYAKGWCIKGSSCRFLHIKSDENTTNEKTEGDSAVLNKGSELKAPRGLGDGVESSSSPADFPKAEASSFGHRSFSSLEKMPLQKEDFSHRVSSDPLLSPTGKGMYQSTGFPFTGSVNSSFSPSVPTSARSRSPFTFSSLDRYSYGAEKLSHIAGGENRTVGTSSLLRSSSPFSGFGSENIYRTNVSSNNWELSVPFRPSFPITQSLLSQVSLYDPIRDSIEQPNSRDRFSNLPFTSEAHKSTEGGHISRTFSLGFSSEDHSRPGREKPQDNGKEKSNTSQEEEKLSSPINMKNIRKVEKTKDNSNPVKKDGSSQKREPKVDRSRTKNGMDVDLKVDGELKESKALRHFRAALIDFVKETVKPMWRDGRLSKDAHKIVVKKAVDKVLSTLQPEQVPANGDSAKLYLSASQPKITKLVEGYVVKYGKL